jgi:hypothetical protein
MEGSLPRRLGTLAFCALVAAAPGVAAQLVNVQPTEPAKSGGAAVSLLSDANSTCIDLIVTCRSGVAVSGTGDAKGGSAASGTGSSQSSYVSLSALGKAQSDGIAITTLGDSNGSIAAVTLMGNATCGTNNGCVAISLTGSATNGTAISGCALLMRVSWQAGCNQDSMVGTYYEVMDLMS